MTLERHAGFQRLPGRFADNWIAVKTQTGKKSIPKNGYPDNRESARRLKGAHPG
jgi:hypothetical protein